MSSLKIAIQNRGRLSEESAHFLQSLGLQFTRSDRSLMTSCDNADIDIFFLRSSDIPEYVSAGVADFGITGENVLHEKKAAAIILRYLGFARCRLVIAVPENSQIKNLHDLEGERIATSYPHILSQFLKKRHIHSSLVPITGSVEVAPELHLADAICDITQSGNTLAAHNLTELANIMKSQAVLIESPFITSRKAEFLERL